MSFYLSENNESFKTCLILVTVNSNGIRYHGVLIVFKT